MSNKVMEQILHNDLCAGCGACAGVFSEKVKIEMSSSGFFRPKQFLPLSEVEEGSLANFCPAIGQSVEAHGRVDHTLWGPYLEMWTGYSLDPEVRYSGASGGALSSLLLYLLESGEVDAVVQTAGDEDVPIANQTVISTDRRGVLAAASSRYAPSAPLAHLSKLLTSKRRYAFVGKPCDVAALRALAAKVPEIELTFPVMLSFFCAGVPSQKGGNAILAALGADPRVVRKFRYRGRGWPGRAAAVMEDGSELSMTYRDSWGEILSKYVQLRCKICADGTGKAADIVCADAWESDAGGYPVFDEGEGVSLIISRTPLGQRIIEQSKKAGHIQIVPFEVKRLAEIQPGQRERQRALLARLLGLRLTGRSVPRYKGLHLWAAARQNTIGRNLKNFFGIIRRSLRAQLER